MECGKLTAKLRDAVPVYLIEEGRAPMRYKNIEIPDEIKALEYKEFKFDVPASGKISFKIYFEPGTLPEAQPEVRKRNRRTAQATTDQEPIAEGSDTEPNEPARIEINYNITGEARKTLVYAIGEFLQIKPEYLAMPTQAYRIGDYLVSKDGWLVGPNDAALREEIIRRGFTEN